MVTHFILNPFGGRSKEDECPLDGHVILKREKIQRS